MSRRAALLTTALLAACAAHADFDAGAFDGRSDADATLVVVKAPVRAASSDDRLWVVVKAADKVARTRAANAGLSIEEVGPGTAAGVATPAALSRLLGLG